MKVLRLILLIWGIFIFLFISIWHIADSVVFVFFWQKPFLDFKRLILFKLRNSMFQYLLYHLVVLVTVGWEVTMGSSRLTRFHIRDRVWRGGWKWRVLTSKCSHGQAIFVTCDIYWGFCATPMLIKQRCSLRFIFLFEPQKRRIT